MKFALTTGAWAALALAAWGANRFLFDEALDYLAPGILVLGAIHVGLVSRTEPGGAGSLMLKRGVGLFMGAVALWLWLPPEPEAPMPWQPCSSEAVDTARREGRPVMMIFSAAGSAPCRAMERKVFARTEVIMATLRFVVLKADVTDTQSEAARALAAKYAVTAYPTIVFLGPDSAERSASRLVGYEGPKAFVKRLEAVK